MNPVFATFLRALLKMGGGALVTKGLADEATAELIGGGLFALLGVAWGYFSARAKKAAAKPAGLAGLLMVLTICLAGCARFTTTQTDVSYGDNGKPSRSITTRASAQTVFEAKSALASFKASQTDKTQSAAVGGLNQESSGNSSNVVNAAGEILGATIKAALRP